MGSYAYQCDNGSQFSMMPSEDLATIKIAPDTGAMFTATTLSKVSGSAGARYEGGGIIFVGAGEEVHLTVGNTLLVCDPVPNAEMAPWNWGDAGEGGGIQPELSVIVSENMQGKWQSADDAKFVREFKSGGTVVDWYDGKTVSSGTYTVFAKSSPLAGVTIPLEDNTAYLQLKMTGTQAETLNFKITEVTPEELEMTYLDRGGALRFTAVR